MSQAEPSKFNLRKEGKLIMNELSDESFQRETPATMRERSQACYGALSTDLLKELIRSWSKIQSESKRKFETKFAKVHLHLLQLELRSREGIETSYYFRDELWNVKVKEIDGVATLYLSKAEE